MLNQLLDTIRDLKIDPFFYVEQGCLKEKIISHYISEDDAAADVYDFDLQASIQISKGEGLHGPAFLCQLEHDSFEYCVKFSIDDFNNNEIEELSEYLGEYPQCNQQEGQQRKTVILRRNIKENLLNISEAANFLGISQRALKALIPCSQVWIQDNEAGKSLKGYYWEKELICRLRDLREFKHKTAPHKTATLKKDISFISERCCEGDLSWAQDVIRNFLNYQTLFKP